MRETLRLLQVEDSESDAELIARQLGSAGYAVHAERVQDEESMRSALAGSEWDLIICDYRMPGFDAPAALAVLQETWRDIPFVVISGNVGEDLAVAMLKAGAHDYLMKGNLKRLGAAVERELREAVNRANARDAFQKLRDREAQLALAIESTGMGVFDFDPQTGKLFYSDLTRRHMQLPDGTEPTRETFWRGLHPEDRGRIDAAITRVLLPGSGGRYAEEYRTKTAVNGKERWISALGKVWYDADRRPVRFLGVVHDISERKIAERELELQLRLIACITEQSTDAILLHDRDGKVRFINPQAERLFGFTLKDFESGCPHELTHHHYPDGRPFPVSECALFQSIANAGTVRDHEDVFFHRNGTPIDVAVNCTPLVLNGERTGIVFTFRDITGRKRAELALRQSDMRFRRLFEADIIGIMIADGTHILEANDHFLRMLGYTREDFFARKMEWRAITPAELIEANEQALRSLLVSGVCPAFEKQYIRKDGTRVPVLFAAVELNHAGASELLCFAVDLTDRKNLENQFRQSQKLESIGHLAGGVAHDFNNLLTVIMGYSQIAREGIGPGHPLRGALDQIALAGERASGLTRQLLTFSRRNKGDPKTILFDDLVLGIQGMLRRLIGAHIDVTLTPGAPSGLIHADPGLIEQVLVNLAVNARDAMPEGGRLVIETSRVTVRGEISSVSLSAPPGLAPPGEYLCLSVTDTGTGMTPEVQARLFEPFFTTKAEGKGTGLGLSTVYGIVKQSAGAITVDSTPGIGTSFRVLFPAVDGGWVPERAAPPEAPAAGTETILLVEDETGVRDYVREVLRTSGYCVLEAATGIDAIRIARNYDGTIHLLLTDMVLPGLRGAEVIRQFLALRPGIPTLQMSGWPEGLAGQAGDNEPPLQKPFSAEVLTSRVRKILDESRTPTATTRANGA